MTILTAAFLPGAFGQNTSGNMIAGMGYLFPSPVTVAPGQVTTVFVVGSVQGDITATVQQISNHPAPVLGVTLASSCTIPPSAPCSSTTAVTIQIPYEIELPCGVCNLVFPSQLVVTVNGVAGAPIDLNTVADRVHILTACDTASGGSGSAPFNEVPCAPLVTHADGSMVTQGSPAQGSEEVVAYAVGLGATSPAVPTGKAATAATPTPTV